MDRSATTDPLVGQLLDGRYRVGERIARGGMATVYEATDLRLDRLVAIKVMPHSLADDQDFSQRFVREARAAARLTHPNVVAVYDQGDDDGTLFLAMEYVAGRHTLRDVIRDEAPLSGRRALSLLEEILKAIAAAHESGIIHRDVKPENVLIDPRGQVKVADFGLARAISSATTATATGGVLMGTVSYLPPELVTEGASDARSDVYSLGVMLFEMLTGRKPHAGESPIQIAYKHVHEDVPAPSSSVAGIPPYLDAFVARATSRRRDLRPADAHVMLQQLRRVRHALDNGVIDDQELTDDLTPTIAIVARPEYDVELPSGLFDDAYDRTAPFGNLQPVDEVFDLSRCDDFDDQRHQGRDVVSPQAPLERTLVADRRVGEPHRFQSGSRRPASVGSSVAGSPVISPQVPGTPEPASGAVGAPRSRHERTQHSIGKRRGWIAFVVVLLLAVAAAASGWWYGVGRFTPTPNVISLSQEAAKARVVKAGLTFQVASASYSEKVPPGHVVSTDPGAGDNVQRGGIVTAIISKGPERHAVPVLSGMTESQAVAAIKASSLRVATLTRTWNERVPRRSVISVAPASGTALRRDARVHLVISRGPRPIRIVDWMGKDSHQATSALGSAGFKVLSKERYDDNSSAGTVISQFPRHGTGHAHDSIRLVVSKGPHLVQVPDVRSYGVSDAEQALAAAGFHVVVVHHSPYFGLGFVVSQSSDGGAMAPFHSIIRIEIV